MKKFIPHTHVVPKRWYAFTIGVSKHAPARISPFSLLEVEHIWSDDERPERTLLNFSRTLGAFDAAEFMEPTALSLLCCRPFMALRRLREKLWCALTDSVRILFPRK